MRTCTNDLLRSRSQKLWPHIRTEIILVDYLFVRKSNVSEEEATMLVALLLDLQEDYRNAVKRGFLKYILRFEWRMPPLRTHQLKLNMRS